MKLTPANRKMISFMSGPYGRWARAVAGVLLLALATTQLGWYLVFLPMGLFMIWTALANFCPVTLMFPEWKKEQQILKDVPTFKLDN